MCWICGEGDREGDPFTADHVIPAVRQPRDEEAVLLAAHRSCNSRRGRELQMQMEAEEMERLHEARTLMGYAEERGGRTRVPA